MSQFEKNPSERVGEAIGGANRPVAIVAEKEETEEKEEKHAELATVARKEKGKAEEPITVKSEDVAEYRKEFERAVSNIDGCECGCEWLTGLDRAAKQLVTAWSRIPDFIREGKSGQSQGQFDVYSTLAARAAAHFGKCVVKLRVPPYVILIGGSIARGESLRHSDCDVLVLYDETDSDLSARDRDLLYGSMFRVLEACLKKLVMEVNDKARKGLGLPKAGEDIEWAGAMTRRRWIEQQRRKTTKAADLAVLYNGGYKGAAALRTGIQSDLVTEYLKELIDKARSEYGNFTNQSGPVWDVKNQLFRPLQWCITLVAMILELEPLETLRRIEALETLGPRSNRIKKIKSGFIAVLKLRQRTIESKETAVDQIAKSKQKPSSLEAPPLLLDSTGKKELAVAAEALKQFDSLFKARSGFDPKATKVDRDAAKKAVRGCLGLG